jgi:hypothetical protein
LIAWRRGRSIAISHPTVGHRVRVVALLLFLLLLAGWVLVELPQKPWPEANASPWRRTANGWENTERWSHPTGQPYRLSPLLVGALQVGISLVALTAASDAKSRRQPLHSEALEAPNRSETAEFS